MRAPTGGSRHQGSVPEQLPEDGEVTAGRQRNLCCPLEKGKHYSRLPGGPVPAPDIMVDHFQAFHGPDDCVWGPENQFFLFSLFLALSLLLTPSLCPLPPLVFHFDPRMRPAKGCSRKGSVNPPRWAEGVYVRPFQLVEYLPVHMSL